MPFVLGIDIGSTAVKGVLYSGKVLKWGLAPTGWSPKDAGSAMIDQLLRRRKVSRGDLTIVATGYGRKTVEGARAVTEITCHARGAHELCPQARTVLDIGGQDSKVILLGPAGEVRDFAMNDKCAAGTGRFFQVLSHALEYDIEQFGAVPANGEIEPLSSMCTVFAESEVIGNLARGVPRDNIARGLLKSIAARSAGMLGKVGMVPPLFFSGGLSRSPSLKCFLEQELNCPVYVHERSQFAGALGAALIGWEGLK